MRRIATLTALVLAIGMLPGLSSAAATDAPISPGPFAGTVEDGETTTHTFSNHVPMTGCAQVVVPYLVVVEYAPATDALTVTVDRHMTTGENGVAILEFGRSPCTSFDIEVTGEDVSDTAAYMIEVAWLG